MPRDPTKAERKAIRSLLSAAGSEAEFMRWVDVAKVPHAPGAPKKEFDSWVLPGLELFVAIAMKERHMSRSAVLKWWAQFAKGAEPDTSAEAIWRRLDRKLKAGGFEKFIAPPGIDITKLTTFPFSRDPPNTD
jgi:hypothetical protein